MPQTEASLSWNVLCITKKKKLLKKERERDLPRLSLLGASRYNSAEEDAIAFALSSDWIWPSLQWEVLPFGFSILLILAVLSAPSCILFSQQIHLWGNVHASFCFPHENARRDDGKRDCFFTVPAMTHPLNFQHLNVYLPSQVTMPFTPCTQRTPT